MKDSLKYLMLWQEKRSGMPVNDDPQSDWLQMQDLLDKHLPVAHAGGGGTPPRGLGFKTLSTLFISVSAAAMIYVGVHTIQTKKHKHRAGISRDSLSKAAVYDSLNVKDSSADTVVRDSAGVIGKDSLAEAKRATALYEADAAAKQGVSKGSVGPSSLSKSNKDSSALAGKDNSLAVNGQRKDRSGSANQGNKLTQSSPVSGSSASPGKLTSAGRYLSNGKRRNGTSAGSNDHPGSPHARDNNGIVDHYALNSGNELSPVGTGNNLSLITLSPPPTGFNFSADGGGFSKISPVVQNNKAWQIAVKSTKDKPAKDRKVKNPSAKNPAASKLDWGILAGGNSPGTSKLPADLYFGPYATYNLSNKVGLNLQLRLFSPYKITGSYTGPNGSKVDTQATKLTVNDSRKIYAIEVPLYVEYKLNPNISLKAGPVVSIPLKQADGKSILLDSLRGDGAYRIGIIDTLNRTKYSRNLNYGISAGVGIHVNRWSLEATYLKMLSGQKITSDLGGYSSKAGTVQLTLGFRLNKK